MFYNGILAIISGAILPFSFAPFNYYLLAECSLILLLFLSLKSSPKITFLYYWLFGIGFFSVGIYWIYISIHFYGHASIIHSILISTLLIGFMSVYLAFQGYLLQVIAPNNTLSKFLFGFPTLWTIFEWIRGAFFNGFPWLFLGYSHINSCLCGFAPILGVFGISFFIAQTAGAIFYLIFINKNKKEFIKIFCIIIALWNLGNILSKINWVYPIGEKIRVSLIQGNIAQDRKWDKNELYSILNLYSVLSIKNFKSQIIVWPETAIPALQENISNYIESISSIAKKNQVTLLTGILIYNKVQNRYYNGILRFGNDFNAKPIYYKRYLVPFGEYFPLKFIKNLFNGYINISTIDLSSGNKYQPLLNVNEALIAPFICYEIAYPNLILSSLPLAEILLVTSDDSWFGHSIAADQHLEIAQMRSLEVGRYQLISNNTGITAVIDIHGKIFAKIPSFKASVLTCDIPRFKGKTPWVLLGRYIWLPILFSMLIYIYIINRICQNKK